MGREKLMGRDCECWNGRRNINGNSRSLKSMITATVAVIDLFKNIAMILTELEKKKQNKPICPYCGSEK